MSNRHIQFINLQARHKTFVDNYHAVLSKQLKSGNFIMGDVLSKFEKSIANYMGVKHVIGVANGTDALTLPMKYHGIGSGDEVITSPMSYLATTSSIALCNAQAVFIDIDQSLNLDPAKIEAAITNKTKAIMLVHLSGLPAEVEKIRQIANQNNLLLIEDCAQSIGATFNSKKVGSFGHFAGVSFHPLKNLGGLGDGGAIMTSCDKTEKWLRMARNHGHSSRDDCDFWSINSRLDALQAGFLQIQLEKYDDVLNHRRNLAGLYRDELNDFIEFPELWHDGEASYNWIMILAENRSNLVHYLSKSGIETKIHYPILIPDLKAAKHNCRIADEIPKARHYVDRILSLPNGEHITNNDVSYICKQIKQFYR